MSVLEPEFDLKRIIKINKNIKQIYNIRYFKDTTLQWVWTYKQLIFCKSVLYKYKPFLQDQYKTLVKRLLVWMYNHRCVNSIDVINGFIWKACTCENLQADLREGGEGRLIQHTNTAHLLDLSRVHTLPSDRFQDVPHRCRLLERSLEQIYPCRQFNKGSPVKTAWRETWWLFTLYPWFNQRKSTSNRRRDSSVAFLRPTFLTPKPPILKDNIWSPSRYFWYYCYCLQRPG